MTSSLTRAVSRLVPYSEPTNQHLCTVSRIFLSSRFSSSVNHSHNPISLYTLLIPVVGAAVLVGLGVTAVDVLLDDRLGGLGMSVDGSQSAEMRASFGRRTEPRSIHWMRV